MFDYIVCLFFLHEVDSFFCSNTDERLASFRKEFLVQNPDIDPKTGRYYLHLQRTGEPKLDQNEA